MGNRLISSPAGWPNAPAGRLKSYGAIGPRPALLASSSQKHDNSRVSKRALDYLKTDLVMAGLIDRVGPVKLRPRRVYLVNYGTTLSRRSANEAARALELQDVSQKAV
jgi:hypothetical protein